MVPPRNHHGSFSTFIHLIRHYSQSFAFLIGIIQCYSPLFTFIQFQTHRHPGQLYGVSPSSCGLRSLASLKPGTQMIGWARIQMTMILPNPIFSAFSIQTIEFDILENQFEWLKSVWQFILVEPLSQRCFFSRYFFHPIQLMAVFRWAMPSCTLHPDDCRLGRSHSLQSVSMICPQ